MRILRVLHCVVNTRNVFLRRLPATRVRTTLCATTILCQTLRVGNKEARTTSVRLTQEDEELFLRAMDEESMDKLSSWIVRAARIHARDVLGESKSGSFSSKLRIVIREELSKILSGDA